MKKIMSFALVLIMMSLCAVIFVGCSTASDSGDLPTPPPSKEETPVNPTPDPTPDPEPVDTTQWNTVGAKTLSVDENRLVKSTIFGLKHNGAKDSLVLNYVLGFQLVAPDTVRLPNPGTELTAYAGPLSFPGASYEHYWQGKDSLVTETVTKGYKTSYFNVVWETTNAYGYTIIKGMPEPYKYDNISSQAIFNKNSLQKYCEPYEVERGDSVYLREELRPVVQMTFHGRTFVEEKKVVVDHFLRMKEKEGEKEKKEDKINADEWIKGLGRLVSLTKCLREDTRFWCDAALIEGADGYTIVLDTYNTSGGFVGREVKFVSYEVCLKTNDYDGVAYVNGGFYPGTITYDAASRGWVVVAVVNGAVLDQSIDARDADARGIKNFKDNNTAYPWPYMTNTSTSKEVNGKKVITVSGKTSTRAYRGCVVADSSLKK